MWHMTCFGDVEINTSLCIIFIFVAVMQPPLSNPIDLNTYRARKYAAIHGRGNRTGL